MVLARAQADAIGWRDHPYDALLKFYEPGETLGSLRRLFGALREGLTPILAAARARPKPRDVLSGNFALADQLTLCARLAAAIGYDFGRGRLDTTVHPFEISFTREDVRITTRAKPKHIGQSIFGTLHESGHGLYEQNVDPAFTRSVFATDLLGLYAVGGTSYGAHESQSRLFENHVGRSEAFWRHHYRDLIEVFPAFADVPLAEFLAAVTRVEPGLIRTDADEVTYDFHIMLRVEIEAALIDGSLAARDVPAAWRARMKETLGLDVPNDREGVPAGRPLGRRPGGLVLQLHRGEHHGGAAFRCRPSQVAAGRGGSGRGRCRPAFGLAQGRGMAPRPPLPEGRNPDHGDRPLVRSGTIPASPERTLRDPAIEIRVRYFRMFGRASCAMAGGAAAADRSWWPGPAADRRYSRR